MITEVRSVVSGGLGGGRRGLSGVMESFYIWIDMLITQVFISDQTLRTIHLRFVRFLVCEKFYLNSKSILKSNESNSRAFLELIWKNPLLRTHP